jgi:broad specificity phosphatase PhoE
MNQSKIFYLVRHGLATHSTHGYGKRKLTAALLPEGVPAIQKMAQFLKTVPTSTNISSEIIRCRETSAIIEGVTGKKFIFDARLNEDYHETIGELRTRVHSFLDSVFKSSHTHIIVCTHGVIVSAIKNLLVNGAFVTRHMRTYDYPQTGELMIIEGKNIRLINFN